MEDDAEFSGLEFIQRTSGAAWMHPRVAIKAAAWCRESFVDLIIDAVSQHYAHSPAEESSVNTRPLQNDLSVTRVTVNHVNLRQCTDMDDMGVPLEFLAPNAFYIIVIGMDEDGNIVFKWGVTEDLKSRIRTHRNTYGNVIVRLAVSVGDYAPKRIEDSVKDFLQTLRVGIQLGDKFGRETFVTSEADQMDVLVRIQNHIETKFGHMCQVSSLDGVTTRKSGETMEQKIRLLEAEAEVLRLELQVSRLKVQPC
jgi:hypothetical protein